ncbi:MAG: DUF4430 domain-containing protein [Clostridia bacterium]|nr:DUF4430 domain-containing protein [Clostridia bacterium]
MKVFNRKVRSLLSAAFCLMLVAVMVLSLSACRERSAIQDPPQTTAKISGDEIIEKGTGATAFTFKVVNKAGETTTFSIKTDKKTVGDALVDVDLIAGDIGDYGLYVKTVNGETLDYVADGYYWAFYENGEYAMTGVDSTDIAEGVEYSFVATAADATPAETGDEIIEKGAGATVFTF